MIFNESQNKVVYSNIASVKKKYVFNLYEGQVNYRFIENEIDGYITNFLPTRVNNNCLVFKFEVKYNEITYRECYCKFINNGLIFIILPTSLDIMIREEISNYMFERLRLFWPSREINKRKDYRQNSKMPFHRQR